MNLRRVPRAAGWLLAAIALVTGVYVLILSWDSFLNIAVNIGSGRPPGRHAIIILLHALPGFEVGVIAGMLPFVAHRGVGRLVLVLTLSVWAEIAVNTALLLLLFPY